jgi:nitrogen-specific signal transduction histidine kinase
VVAGHGGTDSVTSESGDTVFRVELPVAPIREPTSVGPIQ